MNETIFRLVALESGPLDFDCFDWLVRVSDSDKKSFFDVLKRRIDGVSLPSERFDVFAVVNSAPEEIKALVARYPVLHQHLYSSVFS